MASNGLVAIVTGAAQGIGYAISDTLLREGYKVCQSDINADKGNESLRKLQQKYAADRVIFAKCDVTSKSNLEEVFTKTQKEFGKIDVVVNNAGILDEYNPERMMAINFIGTLYGCQLAIEFMGTKNGGQGGAVVNISSIAGIVPLPNIPVYTASKHAVVGLTRSYGAQDHLEQNGVIFMAVCPYFVKTAMLVSPKALIDFDESAVLSVAIDPESVAEGVLVLLKDRRNGSTLLALPSGHEYTELEEKVKKIASVTV